jgi:hypothetical protein
MFTNRVSKIVIVLIVLAIASVTVSFVARPPAQLVASHMEPRYVVLERQAIREYVLGERYGEMPHNAVLSTAEHIQREYSLGERYGVTPREYARQQALREYWLGERYGQTH